MNPLAIKFTTTGEPSVNSLTRPGHLIDNQDWSQRTKTAKKKERLLNLFEQGYTRDDALRLTNLSLSSWKYYKASDPDFKARVDTILAQREGGRKYESGEHLPFDEFSEKYFGQQLFRHQLQWVDLIEGREPRDLLDGQTYVPGSDRWICVNTPPGHGKSTTLTMNYVTYRIVTDPTFRVVIVSKTQTMAKKFLMGIKRRLTNASEFGQLIADYSPPEGFEKTPGTIWTSQMIYFGHAATGEKDPTVECLGVGQQIYGARADLIIIDDAQDTHNYQHTDAHLTWLQQDVMSRDARVFLVGTRVAPVDLYSEIVNPERYSEDLTEVADEGWTYLTQPAVLEYSDDPADWVTLWPKSNVPHAGDSTPPDEDGLYPKWDGRRLAKLRRVIEPRLWSLIYMQEQVTEDAIFPMEAINGCKIGNQGVGKLHAVPNANTFKIVAGLDPASDMGYTAAVVLAVDRHNQELYVLDVRNKKLKASGIQALIKELTDRYHINEWRIERNAFQSYLTQDKEITRYLGARGCRITDHQTQAGNKWDHLWGVQSMEMLFRGWEDGENMIHLPGSNLNEGIKTLIEQLSVWHPDAPKTQKTDTVMALWFAVIAAREHFGQKRGDNFMNNPFASGNNRVVVDIHDYLAEQRMGIA